MGLKKVLKYYILGESLKEIEANRILDKISKKKNLTDRERKFLDLYNYNSDDKDYMYLSKNSTCERIKLLLKNGKPIICDLSDRNGRFGLPIIDIKYNHTEQDSIIFMKGNETHKLKDSFLYNLIYNIESDKYSLQEQDEYYEKIKIDND